MPANNKGKEKEVRLNESWLERVRTRHYGHFYRMNKDRKLVFSTKGWEWLAETFWIIAFCFTLFGGIPFFLILKAYLKTIQSLELAQFGQTFSLGAAMGIDLALFGFLTLVGLVGLTLAIISTINAKRFKPIEDKDWKEYLAQNWPEDEEDKPKESSQEGQK